MVRSKIALRQASDARRLDAVVDQLLVDLVRDHVEPRRTAMPARASNSSGVYTSPTGLEGLLMTSALLRRSDRRLEVLRRQFEPAILAASAR